MDTDAKFKSLGVGELKSGESRVRCPHTTSGFCSVCVGQLRSEIEMLRACNEQLVANEQFARSEANRLRSKFKSFGVLEL